MCAGRLAPLSEGRIEPSDGTLMCSYHGWRFAGDGACVAIPQATDARAQAAASASPRSCVVMHPAQARMHQMHVPFTVSRPQYDHLLFLTSVFCLSLQWQVEFGICSVLRKSGASG